jgi:hypothetical protein
LRCGRARGNRDTRRGGWAAQTAATRAPPGQGAWAIGMTTSGAVCAGDRRAISWRWAAQAPCRRGGVRWPVGVVLRAGCSSLRGVSGPVTRGSAAQPEPCSVFSHVPPWAESPSRPGGVERRHQGKTRCIVTQQHPLPRLRFFLTRPALLERPVASPGRLVERGTVAERGGWQGAARPPAWPCAAPRARGAATGLSPALHRSRAPAHAHSAAGRLSPRPDAAAPTSRDAAPMDREPLGAVHPARPAQDTASATAARSCAVPRTRERWACAAAPASPSRPRGTGRGGGGPRWW